MAKVKVVMAVTLDGFLPKENEHLMQWLKNDNRGFPRWRDGCTYPLFPHYPLLDLICQKNRESDSFIYLAEILDEETAELLRGLSLYKLVDEMIVYQVPVSYGTGFNLKNHFQPDNWMLCKIKSFRNNICCMRYKRVPDGKTL
ncbi:hypothetical protein [Bacteroides reticulotermitis]|uniref:Dihydrofolate reductase n=2 Tax=Bacteroides reticulotermitis TaxID=1133319 RepID=W4UVF6_9BACE|nr:hypothetical protein [Bacteroides reticulotermitis]MBB4045770.1 hypothetical protein [Bacteroides reticulotermitis]GAE84911.1 hypothetical protein JCM10512_3289 [Bacteroides reticulotermitis JCM 10512]